MLWFYTFLNIHVYFVHVALVKVRGCHGACVEVSGNLTYNWFSPSTL